MFPESSQNGLKCLGLFLIEALHGLRPDLVSERHGLLHQVQSLFGNGDPSEPAVAFSPGTLG